MKRNLTRVFAWMSVLLTFGLIIITAGSISNLSAQENDPVVTQEAPDSDQTETPEDDPAATEDAAAASAAATDEAVSRVIAPTPKPDPSAVIEQDGVTLELYFERIPQGGAGVLYVYGEGVVGARARWFNDVIEFFTVNDHDDSDDNQPAGYYGLISVSIEQAARDYDLTVFAVMEDDARVEIPVKVPVGLGGFIKQTIEIPTERAYLVDPEIERTEFARMDAIFRNITPEVLWDSGEIDFQYPIHSAITSPFGAVRVLNGTVETRHTGWDLRAATGTPVMSIAAGKVVFAGPMDIRGNLVIVDHGYGVYSTYCHFSVIHVVRGQKLTKGQILGLSGNSGRSSGPHLHWEVNINGEWVDSVNFMSMWLPG